MRDEDKGSSESEAVISSNKKRSKHTDLCFIEHFPPSPSCAHSAVDSESDDEQPPPPPPSGDPSALSNDEDAGDADPAKDSEWMWDDFMDAVEENDADGVTLLLDSLPRTSRQEVGAGDSHSQTRRSYNYLQRTTTFMNPITQSQACFQIIIRRDLRCLCSILLFMHEPVFFLLLLAHIFVYKILRFQSLKAYTSKNSNH